MQARNTTQVASNPTFTGKRQISKRGQPLWRGDGKELFYFTLDGKLEMVEVKGGAMPQASVPQVLFQTPTRVNPNQTEYCVSNDGKRFIFREPVGESQAPITVVLNWNAGLKH